MKGRAQPAGRSLDLGRPLTLRTERGLRRAGLVALEELLQLTRRDLLRRPGIGTGAAKEIEEALAGRAHHRPLAQPGVFLFRRCYFS